MVEAPGPGGGGLGPASRSLYGTESLMVPMRGPVGGSMHGGEEEREGGRKRILSDLFDEEEVLCEGCVMTPCVCLLNVIELRIVEEKERRLRRSSQPTSAPIMTQSPSTTTATSPQPTTSTTGERATSDTRGGQDCNKEKDVKLLSEMKNNSKDVRGPGRSSDCHPTTTPRSRRTRMKATNNSNKKVTRMTNKEKEETKRSTRDIRGFFKLGEEQSGPGLVQRLVKAAETHSLSSTTTANREVSPMISGINSCIPSRMMKNSSLSAVEDDERKVKRTGEVKTQDMTNLMIQERKDALRKTGSATVKSMRGNTRATAGYAEYSVTGTDQGACKRRGGDSTTDDVPGMKNIVCLKGVARKDVPAVMNTDDVRGDLCVVRPNVATISRGACRARVGDDGNDVPGVPDEDRPVGGDERSLPHIPKPNPVRGGLLGRVQFWEMKTEQLLNENQDDIATEYNTAFNTEGKLGARHRKKKTYDLKQQDQE